jgi:hypothetical protein
MPDLCNNAKAFVHKPDPLNALERKHTTQKRKQRKQNLYTRHDGESLVAEGVTLENEKEQKDPQNKTGKQ